uniref:Uridine 5'-monophosphate synthase n=1 Tax=Oreochromis niloticus TaxID=8128 RepID=I3J8H7_ORENI
GERGRRFTASLILKLHDVNGVKFGEYKLKSGLLIYERVQEEGLQFHSVCGAPYTALPLATVICSQHELPMVIRRKEAKDYGTKRLVEGSFRQGDTCLIIEDTVTSGTSILETAEVLCKEGLKVTDAVVLMDREQGGVEMLASKGIKLHPIISISQLLRVLQAAERIDAQTAQSVHRFIQDNNRYNFTEFFSHKKLELRYSDRAELPIQTETARGAAAAESLDPKICMLKTHVDVLEDYTSAFIQKVQALAEKHNFLIFEDRKFADIRNTVKHQYEGGLYQISSWSHIVNAHAVPGPGVLKGLSAAGKPLGRGCLLVAQMSSQDHCLQLFCVAQVQMAEEHSDFVMGFICGSKLTERPEFIHMTPGVQMQAGGDLLGQQYTTPEEVVQDKDNNG